MRRHLVNVLGSDETKQDPVGLLDTKAFLWPPFLDYRK